MILSCKDISKSFGTDVILSDVSFTINKNEKVAIVGINGAGKTTLLRILIGDLPADSGTVTVAKDTSIGYLSQQQDLSCTRSIYDEVASVKEEVMAAEREIRDIEQAMKHASGDELDSLMKQYSERTHYFEQSDGYAAKSEIVGVLKGLGFSEDDFPRMVDTLSGGQKTRVALSKLLLEKPDIIILDEPTNHLDMQSIVWLEGFLGAYSGTVIVVSHDRFFLDRFVDKVVEIDNTKGSEFAGNYSSYAEKKAKQREIVKKHYLNQQREIKHQEEVIAKLKSFNREKSIKRAESREKMLDKIERVEKPAYVKDDMNLKLTPNILSGNDVLSVKNVSKSFGDLTLFEKANFEIKRGEKVAIIGNNGTGKTTMLKIINGIAPSDSGEVILGAKVYVGYYDQEHHVLDPEKSLYQEISDAYPRLDNTQIRNTLAAFLFTGDDVFKLVKELSGGEKGRVSLAKLMLSKANFLILDEPTNHLDITSKEILEDAIAGYEGTVLYVSHDRYFINKTATRILELRDGQFLNFPGNYDRYLEKKDIYSPAASDTKTKDSTESVSETKRDWNEQKKDQAALRKRKNDLKKCEDEIADIENSLESIDAELLDESVFTDHAKLMEITGRKKELEERLGVLMGQWEELASII